MLSIDQIRAAKDRPREFVAIEEWTPEGESFDPAKHGVFVGVMAARDKDAWELEVFGDNSADARQNARAKLAVRTVQNDDGSLMFAPADSEWLGTKSQGPLSTIFDVAMRLNKMSAAAHEETVKAF